MSQEQEQSKSEAPASDAIGADATPIKSEAADPAAQLAETRDQLLRALAEVDNVRKRGERAAQEARVYAIERFARDLTAVADNLQRALHSAPAAPDDSVSTLIEGVRMTEKALMEIFARHGLKPVGAKGERFDPTLHQAVAQTPSEEAPAGAISEVFQVGFTLGERTVRPAMVAVSTGPAAEAVPPPGETGANVDVTT